MAASKIEVFVRALGSEGFSVGARIGVGAPVMYGTYSPDLSTIPPTTTAECRAKAYAHKQGIIDGMRLAANILEGVTP